MSHLSDLKKYGFQVLHNLFDQEQIYLARKEVLGNLNLFKNTRSYSSSRHLAGFHRYPKLEKLHTMISTNRNVCDFLIKELGGMDVITIGLSDITINRSQQWHSDLLRGHYSSYLNDDICWGPDAGGVFKALLYLQEGKSLAVVPGSHLNKISLNDDSYAIPNDPNCISYIQVKPGDVVIMDIRLIHRGSSDNQMQNLDFDENAKILISTVFGGINCPLTDAMENGNFLRLKAWIDKNK